PPAGANPAAPPPAGQGRIRVRDIDLGRLANALRAPALRPLEGRFNLVADFSYTGPGGEAAGTGRVELDDLTWDEEPILSTLRGEVRVRGGEVRLSDLTAQVAGGSLRALLAYNYRDPRRSFLNLTLDRADAKSLFAPFTNSPPLEGPIDVRIRGRLGAEWFGTAELVMGRGKVVGLTVSDARFPLNWSVTPRFNGQIRLNDASAQSSMGRLTGKADYTWG